jgi:BirA family biotin operon repressor/biotin-[acetyl-CoA-carboxylase] ligase
MQDYSIHRIHFSTIDSTNTWAKSQLHTFDRKKITLVTAEEQTGGRGRFNRVWTSPAQCNIYASFCFFFSLLGREQKEIGHVGQLMGISAAQALEQLNFSIRLKWPNDLMLAKKKLGGILCETVQQPQDICVVVGIGLNVNMPEHLLQNIDKPATSLMLERGAPLDVAHTLHLLEKAFTHNLRIFAQSGFSTFLAAYRNKLAVQPGELMRFHDGKQLWEGHFQALLDDGGLQLLLADQTLKAFHSGEIV